MLYNSPSFFILMALTLFVYFSFQQQTIRRLILIFSSMLFYAWSGWFDFAIFMVIIALCWSCSLLIARNNKYRKVYLWAGVGILILHLFVWKYFAAICTGIQSFYPGLIDGNILVLPLPVGISFITLQGIAYLVDIFRKEKEPLSLSHFILFKSFFPQLIAGPIVRIRHVGNQISSLANPSRHDVILGSSLFVLGFYKKTILGDRMGTYVDPIFQAPGGFSALSLAFGAIAYTVQIWADFSGYTDMGRGVAYMLGFHIPQNFLAPYFVSGPQQFWRNWHISLSEWIRDYIYIPLGGRKGSGARGLFAISAAMILSGIWHGAGLVFPLWGFYHLILILIERWGKNRRFLPKSFSKNSLIRPLPMFFLTVFGWIIFRSHNLQLCWEYFLGLTKISDLSIDKMLFVDVTFAFFACLIIQHQTLEDSLFRRKFSVWLEHSFVVEQENSKLFIRAICWGLLTAFCIGIAILLRPGFSGRGFIYFQF